MPFPRLTIAVPGWVESRLARYPAEIPELEARMALAVELSRLSLEHAGGPFGAAVFDLVHHRLIAPGVNRVVSGRCSLAHAEIMALALAEQALGSYDLGAPGMPGCELVTSTAPCSQCYGAIPWSGVRRVVCGARTRDAEAIGFSEGDKPGDWTRVLGARGIEVVQDVQREQAVAVLDEYQRRGLPIYNSHLQRETPPSSTLSD